MPETHKDALSTALHLCAALESEVARLRDAESAAAIWEQRCAQATALSGQHLADLAAALRERGRLQAFKDWVHSYLDSRGVPNHPPGPHGAEGCRIGDRLDWLLAHRARLESVEGALRDAIGIIEGEAFAPSNGRPRRTEMQLRREAERLKAALGAAGEEQSDG